MKNKKNILIILSFIGIGLLGLFAYKCVSDYIAANEYATLKNIALVPPSYQNPIHDEEGSSVPIHDEDISSVLSSTEPFAFGPDASPDWEYLLSLNPDICAWIHMAPDISYPVTFCGDNSFYLDHTFNKTYSSSGCIFLNGANHPDFNDRNTILYGHNMKNQTMFGKLKYYKETSYVEQYPYIYIYLPDNTVRTYEIFNVMICDDGTSPYNITMETDEDMQEYLNSLPVIQREIVTPSDSIITLSTCSGLNSSRRLIIQAVRINNVEDF